MGWGGLRDWAWRALIVAIACLLAVLLPPVLPVHAATAATTDQGPADVDLPPILAPMLVSNHLDGYAYISISLTPSGRDKVVTIREKMPFLQDAFLRELNKAPIVKGDNPKAVDTDGVKARLVARMNQILPAGTVAELKLEQIVLVPFQSSS
jgi:flagellar basal body-associated protein FliL